VSRDVRVEKTVEHAKMLVRAGMSASDIAERSGVSKRRVQRILKPSLEMIHWLTEEAILGVPVPVGRYMPKVDGLTDATPSRRRLQALAVQGFPVSYLCREADMSKPILMNLRSGMRNKALVSSSVKIRLVHDELWDTDPLTLGIPARSVSTAKVCAARGGWFPTEAWRDIDDPSCEPSLNAPRYVILTENARELMGECGHSKREAAERLGVSVNTLDKAISYHDAKVS
jgi:transcriptional regulator with XRE-family HTH domain